VMRRRFLSRQSQHAYTAMIVGARHKVLVIARERAFFATNRSSEIK